MEYDYIIIGSGFGGSVSALRLSEKGYKVLVIEKGKWYQANDFAKTNWDIKRWLWIPFLRCFGIMKMSFFRHITIASGVGVGGGSLVYANTLPIPTSAFFNTGSWSELNPWEEVLKPYYKTALKMLGAEQNPILFDADKALKSISQQIEKENHFFPTNVSVYFGKPNITQPDPYFNGKGPARTGCTFCGACMTGCPNNSKNSLDKNYLYLAQANGTKILAEKEVYSIKPINSNNGSDGYEVCIKDSTTLFKSKSTIKTKAVIFSGGVIGSIKLLLQLKKTTLPNLSKKLGQDIRTNNETLISVSTLEPNLNFSKGVAIGSILHTDDNSHLEVVRYGEGSNAWKILHLPYSASKIFFIRFITIIKGFIFFPLQYFKIYFKNNWAKKTVVLLFMQTIDSTITFKKNIFGGMKSSMSSGKKPTPFIPESIKLTSLYSKQVNGKASSFVGEALFGIPSTAHILGGAVMGKDADSGVIDKNNKVFGYENMYIIDGSMISANPGVNPSLSITAIAEHAMSKIKSKETESFV